MQKAKKEITTEERIRLVEKYLNNEGSLGSLAKTVGVSYITLKYWVDIYKNEGPTGLLPQKKYRSYSIEVKIQAVSDYLNGMGSLNKIARKYNLRSPTQLINWIKVYNTHGNFKSESGGSRMSESRKTSYEERIEIVHYCILNNHNYGLTAIKYHVSYQQVRNWVLKYEKMGEQGLQDRRGHRTGSKPSRTPEEEMRDQLAQQMRRIKYLEMENELLKKVSELERRWDSD